MKHQWNSTVKKSIIRRSKLTPGRAVLRGSRIRKKGPKTIEWERFRNDKLERDSGETSYIKCQDWQINLKACGVVAYGPDLHHVTGREERPDLYFSEENLVWLTRSCHNEAHDQRERTKSKEPENNFGESSD